MSDRADVLVLSLGTTRGLRLADAQLVEMLREAGASVAAVGTSIGLTNALRRAYPSTTRSRRLRRGARWPPRYPGTGRGPCVLHHHGGAARRRPRRAVRRVARLAGRLNRPGIASAPLHALERRQLAAARVLMPHSPGAIEALPVGSAPTVLVPPPIARAPAPADAREPLVIGYTPDPKAKGLALLCAAWERAGLPGARLVIAGIQPERAVESWPAEAVACRRGGARGDAAAAVVPGAAFASPRVRQRGRVGGLRIAPLEALDRGAVLVGAAGGGPFPGLGIARGLAPSFVAADRDPGSLAGALEAAFAADDAQLAAYRVAARAALEPYRPEASVKRLREEVLPALLGDPRP